MAGGVVSTILVFQGSHAKRIEHPPLPVLVLGETDAPVEWHLGASYPVAPTGDVVAIYTRASSNVEMYNSFDRYCTMELVRHED